MTNEEVPSDSPPRSSFDECRMVPPLRHPTAEDLFDRLDVAGAPRELVALGGRLDVATLAAAYRAGCFPWPASGPHRRSLEDEAHRLAETGEVPVLPDTDLDAPLVPWLSPEPRPVLLADAVHVPRSLRRQLRASGWTTTVDVAFDSVLAACADREGTWITGAVQEAYARLHRAGAAHSVEVWAGDALVGGLYGVLVGRVFSGESMFNRVSGASKVAVVDLCDRLVEAGVVLVDTEEASEHMAQLGQITMPREEYLALVHHLRDNRVELITGRLPVARLVARPQCTDDHSTLDRDPEEAPDASG